MLAIDREDVGIRLLVIIPVHVQDLDYELMFFMQFKLTNKKENMPEYERNDANTNVVSNDEAKKKTRVTFYITYSSLHSHSVQDCKHYGLYNMNNVIKERNLR